jgi:transcriptional/translational regulatory protein YebC/TACO1
MHAETKIELKGDTAETFIKFIDAIEELDDVQNVYTNADYEVDLS